MIVHAAGSKNRLKMSKQFHADEHDYDKTLYQLAELGLAVKYKCMQCGSEFDLDVLKLMREHGGETRLRFVQRTSQCTFCSNP